MPCQTKSTPVNSEKKKKILETLSFIPYKMEKNQNHHGLPGIELGLPVRSGKLHV